VGRALASAGPRAALFGPLSSWRRAEAGALVRSWRLRSFHPPPALPRTWYPIRQFSVGYSFSPCLLSLRQRVDRRDCKPISASGSSRKGERDGRASLGIALSPVRGGTAQRKHRGLQCWWPGLSYLPLLFEDAALFILLPRQRGERPATHHSYPRRRLFAFGRPLQAGWSMETTVTPPLHITQHRRWWESPGGAWTSRKVKWSNSRPSPFPDVSQRAPILPA